MSQDKNTQTRYFRVLLHAEVLVEVDVEATTADEAMDKAVEWDGQLTEGVSKVGTYWRGDELVHDESEMCWQIQDVTYRDVKSTTELVDDESDGVGKGLPEVDP